MRSFPGMMIHPHQPITHPSITPRPLLFKIKTTLRDLDLSQKAFFMCADSCLSEKRQKTDQSDDGRSNDHKHCANRRHRAYPRLLRICLFTSTLDKEEEIGR